MNTEYEQFLKSKVIIAENYGFDIQEKDLNQLLKPFNKDVALWALKGGRRALFMNFGMHKTFTQLEIATQCINKTNKPFLVVCPLAVAGEFKRDARKFNIPFPVTYITDTDSIESYGPQIFITNYERVRMGDIDPSKFGGVSFDEASILRNLKTETTNYVIKFFQQVPYRFVATASPAPNEYIEILNYAVFLNVASRGHLLTRFFQRDSTKAGHLTLYPNKEKEFWQWVSTWAVFINKPSDLGYSDEGYIFPPLNIIEHEVSSEQAESYVNEYGELVFFRDEKGDFKEKAAVRRESIKERCDKAFELAGSCKSAIVWHELESERMYLEKLFKEQPAKSVFGSQSNILKEELLISFSEGEFDYLLTKKKIAGSGCNFQHHCHDLIFCSLDDKFNDFIQAIHRVYRFGQAARVNIHIIHTKEQYKTLQTLKRKWVQHEAMQNEMTSLVRQYGLNKDIIKQQMERQIFSNGKKIIIGNATLYNNDTVIVHADKKEMPDNSVDMILTSIPFGDHYEYSDNYNDFGHNHGNAKFFEQMDYLTPNLLRVLKPGHVAAIHVKDRIRYSYQNGTSFTTIADFSGQTVAHFEKEHVKIEIAYIETLLKQKEVLNPVFVADFEKRLSALREDYKNRFYLMGKITVTTDVVRENNQTYRLGWSEQCKDATKMGCGIPEYILLFRKAPTDSKNAYADEPVTKEKSFPEFIKCPHCDIIYPTNELVPIKKHSVEDVYECPKCNTEILEGYIDDNKYYNKDIETYTRATWQLDAHAYWRSDGNRFLSYDELKKFDLQRICNAWERYNKESIYDYKEHLQTCEYLEELGKLSALFMTLPSHSNNNMVWSDVNRMNTLNANQVNSKKEKHICPLQLDIIKRLINRFTKKGDLIDDPFGGLFSTAYEALEMGRKVISVELNSDYFKDGCFYVNSMQRKLTMPTLFDLL